ncbi:MAG: hypothetical protein MAG795_00072 [Candidatus Woesearchaeota archaeon]|nr:hypothetical protein [Candidatus Woesearchaeota archaeon]
MSKKPRLPNNIIVVLAIVFALVSLSSNLMIYFTVGEPKSVGAAVKSQTATASISIIGNDPVLLVTYPNGCEVLSGIRDINATIWDPDSNWTIRNGTFYYSNTTNIQELINRSNLTGYDYIGTQFYDDNEIYTQPWNTTEVNDGIYYSASVIGYDYNLRWDYNKSDNYFAVNNIDEEPDWEEFKFYTSTNLTSLSNSTSVGEWAYVENLTLGSYFGLINLTNTTLNIDGLNLSKYFEIDYRSISLNDSISPCIDGSTYLHFFNTGLVTPGILKSGSLCAWPDCRIISHWQNEIIVWVNEFGEYDLNETAAYNLSIWDVTDKQVYNGNQTRRRGEIATFYANLTLGNQTISDPGINCWMRFNETGNFTQWSNATYIGIDIFEDNYTFGEMGLYDWQVICNSTSFPLYISQTDTINISNLPPYQRYIIPNVTMEEDRSLIFIYLDDYFTDPDGDSLNYSNTYIANIELQIDDSNIVTIIPDVNWFGERITQFIASDGFGGITYSNPVNITVEDVPEPPQFQGGGGGGGGEGSSKYYDYEPIAECLQDWQCGNWSKCMYRWVVLNQTQDNVSKLNNSENDGIQTRTCSDLSHCNYWWNKPNETRWCFYNPTCTDNIKNQNEIGVDCGGVCEPCPSCTDGIQNQGEEDIDCGGPCPSCGTCLDGVKNCHDGLCEENTDCGGPCSACPQKQRPAYLTYIFMWLWWIILLIILLIILWKYVRPKVHKAILAYLAKREEEKKQAAMLPWLVALRKRILEQLNIIQSESINGNVGLLSRQLTKVMRQFFKEVFDVKYEFTYSELMQEISKRNMPRLLITEVSQFLKIIIKMEYGKHKISRAKLQSTVVSAKQIVKLVIRYVPMKYQTKQAEKYKDILQIYRLSIQVHRYISRDELDRAKFTYYKILNLYNKLTNEKKTQVYKNISKLQKDLGKVLQRRGKDNE